MSVKAVGPRPGEHCILCGAPILMNDAYMGAKGDYAHVRCGIQDQHNAYDLDQMRAILDKCQVPATVDLNYGIGQAGRLAWLLDRLGYTIQEIGNPDALTEG